MIVNVVGYFRRQCGLSNNARAIAALLESRAVIVNRIAAKHQFFDDVPFTSDTPSGEVTIWCVNATELITNREFERSYSRRHVGVFMWELEFNRPPHFERAAALMDELWAQTEFLARIYSGFPTVKLPCWITDHEAYPGESSKDPRFTAMFAFDCASIWRRKNPQGVIATFRQAFSNGEKVRLILKANRTHKDPRFFRDLVRTTEGMPVQWITENLPRAEYWKLLRLADVYISLHRSEGIGLTIAEAIAAGVPVIATNYGGNVDFMDERCSFPVPFRMVPNDLRHGPYYAGAMWADPDVGAAANALRALYLDRDYHARLRAGCANVLRDKLNPAAAADAAISRLEFLCRS